MKKLYKFDSSSGRIGVQPLEALFVAREESVDKIIGTTIMLSIDPIEEVMMEESMFTVISEDPEFIETLLDKFDDGWSICGRNPLELSTLEEYKEDDDEEEWEEDYPGTGGE